MHLSSSKNETTYLILVFISLVLVDFIVRSVLALVSVVLVFIFPVICLPVVVIIVVAVAVAVVVASSGVVSGAVAIVVRVSIGVVLGIVVIVGPHINVIILSLGHWTFVVVEGTFILLVIEWSIHATHTVAHRTCRSVAT